jgi:glycosyltransferase involved in cell wall biosynthesis
VVASVEPEAFGRTAIEAAAVGCPVIATDIGAPPETVLAEPAADADAATGWLVPPGVPEALAARLAEALALTPWARSEVAERARRHAARNFSVAAMQQSTLRVYDRLLAARLEARFVAVTAPEGSVSVAHQRS